MRFYVHSFRSSNGPSGGGGQRATGTVHPGGFVEKRDRTAQFDRCGITVKGLLQLQGVEMLWRVVAAGQAPVQSAERGPGFGVGSIELDGAGEGFRGFLSARSASAWRFSLRRATPSSKWPRRLASNPARGQAVSKAGRMYSLPSGTFGLGGAAPRHRAERLGADGSGGRKASRMALRKSLRFGKR